MNTSFLVDTDALIDSMRNDTIAAVELERGYYVGDGWG